MRIATKDFLEEDGHDFVSAYYHNDGTDDSGTIVLQAVERSACESCGRDSSPVLIYLSAEKARAFAREILELEPQQKERNAAAQAMLAAVYREMARILGKLEPPTELEHARLLELRTQGEELSWSMGLFC